MRFDEVLDELRKSPRSFLYVPRGAAGDVAQRFPQAIDVPSEDITALIEQERRQLRTEQAEAERQAGIRRKGRRLGGPRLKL